MAGPIEKLRDRIAPGVHAGAIVKGKLSNKHTSKIRHWGHRAIHSKTVGKLTEKFSNWRRSLRSKRVHVRRITAFEKEFLEALNTGRGLDFEKLRKLNFEKTEAFIQKCESGLDTIKESLPEVRKAKQVEMKRISSLREQRERSYRQQLITSNKQTLVEDHAFVVNNPKMVRDYAMYRMLNKGVPNKEGKLVRLPDYFKQIRDEAQHQLNVQRGNLEADIYKRKLELNEKYIGPLAIEQDPQVVNINQQIAALHVDEGDILNQAMQAFQQDVSDYRQQLESMLLQREQAAEEGTHILSPKPLINWKAASALDMENMIAYYTKAENAGQRYKFAEHYHSVLGLPSDRYRNSVTLSKELQKHIYRMKMQEKVKEDMQASSPVGMPYYPAEPMPSLSHRTANYTTPRLRMPPPLIPTKPNGEDISKVIENLPSPAYDTTPLKAQDENNDFGPFMSHHDSAQSQSKSNRINPADEDDDEFGEFVSYHTKTQPEPKKPSSEDGNLITFDDNDDDNKDT